MHTLNIPAFGETNFTDHRTNATCRVVTVPDAEDGAFDAYSALLEQNGFHKKETSKQGAHRFAAYQKGDDGVFLNDWRTTRELRIATETNCRYFAYTDVCGEATVAPQITQVHLEDFGLSYVIRLSDGRFIIIDGGCPLERDEDSLYRCLVRGTEGEKPVIAAWIMSHPHHDHFGCFVGFMKRYGDKVKMEKLMLNFPEADDVEHYPGLSGDDKRYEQNTSAMANIPVIYELTAAAGATVYIPHTGQKYRIGDAYCEILASMDDTVHVSDNINASSLVIRMELGGQVILWTNDASFGAAKLPEHYGSYLKADILQIPHHGFGCGPAEAEIAGYDLILPEVCLLPVSDYNAFTKFCTFVPSANYIMRHPAVKEFITGEVERTLTLPYTPRATARAELDNAYTAGRASCGATTWFFSELCTANEEDFVFTLVNATTKPATVWIDLLFESNRQGIRYIKTEVGGNRIRRVNIVGKDVDGDAVYFNWLSLKALGVPENVPFAVRFMSTAPIVVSHKTHAPAYHSSGISI